MAERTKKDRMAKEKLYEQANGHGSENESEYTYQNANGKDPTNANGGGHEQENEEEQQKSKDARELQNAIVCKVAQNKDNSIQQWRDMTDERHVQKKQQFKFIIDNVRVMDEAIQRAMVAKKHKKKSDKDEPTVIPQLKIEQMLQKNEEEEAEEEQRLAGKSANNEFLSNQLFDQDGDGFLKHDANNKEVQYYGNIVIDPNEKNQEEKLLRRLTEMVTYENKLKEDSQILSLMENEMDMEEEVEAIEAAVAAAAAAMKATSGEGVDQAGHEKKKNWKITEVLTRMPTEMNADLSAYERMQMLVGRKATDDLASDPLLLNKKQKYLDKGDGLNNEAMMKHAYPKKQKETLSATRMQRRIRRMAGQLMNGKMLFDNNPNRLVNEDGMPLLHHADNDSGDGHEDDQDHHPFHKSAPSQRKATKGKGELDIKEMWTEIASHERVSSKYRSAQQEWAKQQQERAKGQDDQDETGPGKDENTDKKNSAEDEEEEEDERKSEESEEEEGENEEGENEPLDPLRDAFGKLSEFGSSDRNALNNNIVDDAQKEHHLFFDSSAEDRSRNLAISRQRLRIEALQQNREKSKHLLLLYNEDIVESDSDDETMNASRDAIGWSAEEQKWNLMKSYVEELPEGKHKRQMTRKLSRMMSHSFGNARMTELMRQRSKTQMNLLGAELAAMGPSAKKTSRKKSYRIRVSQMGSGSNRNEETEITIGKDVYVYFKDYNAFIETGLLQKCQVEPKM
ncbi:hypothetical protein RFI_07311 [Reticulomyxa filosa]|uniref:Uncharacterized protein n=1 Tax=Reticulomyxa filosa TaxID=46433 RepID=X6NV90_RETFI|nr:hypothetical protein RFI_07311 [Reticulomyxa filosa]|eukprot:ETO29808.1 hypothetical protein RFI_07311 [Reticulomyxa filosa]